MRLFLHFNQKNWNEYLLSKLIRDGRFEETASSIRHYDIFDQTSVFLATLYYNSVFGLVQVKPCDNGASHVRNSNSYYLVMMKFRISVVLYFHELLYVTFREPVIEVSKVFATLFPKNDDGCSEKFNRAFCDDDYIPSTRPGMVLCSNQSKQ